jgi:hypothetical protein
MEVGWDTQWALALGASDPTGRDQRLSLGAFIETCLVLATSEGLAAEFVPGYDAVQRRVGYLVGSATSYPTPFTLADVRARRTWRGAWLPETLDPQLLTWLTEIARLGGVRLVHLSCADVRELMYDVSRWCFDTPQIVEELRTWTQAGGLRTAIRPSTQLATAPAQAFDGTGSVLVLLAPAATGPAGEVDLGRTMLRMWLGLARNGLAAHPHSHLIDSPDTVDRLAQLTGAAHERVLWVARVGRPDHDPAHV